MAYQIHNLSWLAQPLVFPLRCQKPFSPSLGEQEISMCPSDELTSLILSPLSVSSVIFIFPLSLSHCTLMYINHSDPCKQRHIERTARFPVLVHIIYHIDIQCIPPLHLSLSLSPFSIYSLALIHSHSISLSYSPLLPPGLRWSGAGFVALACWRLNATPDECSWCALQFVSGWSPNLSMHSKMAWNLTLNHLYSSPTLILMDCIPSGSTLIPAHWCLLNTNQHLVFHGIFP